MSEVQTSMAGALLAGSGSSARCAPLDENERRRVEGRRTSIGEPLFRLYARAGGRVRAMIRKVVTRLEGDELHSLTLRRIFSAYHGVDVGMYTGGAAFVLHQMAPGTTVGRYCTMTVTSRMFTANHPMNLRSTHPLFYNPRLGWAERDVIPRTKLKIGNDVWIGHNAIVLPSVTTIGDGAIIGAGTVVNRDVPPYAVVVGHPGKIVRYRFSDSVIAELLASRWWEKTPEELKTEAAMFQTPLDGGEIR